MANYQVDADQLYSDSDEDGGTHLPSPKRPRTTARTAPSLGPISLSSFGRGRGSSLARPGGETAPSSFPTLNAKPLARREPAARASHAATRPRAPSMGGSSLGPMGRGRSMTLPAHMTRERAVSHAATDNALSGAASILPEHQRERFLQEQMKKRAAGVPERKRPGVRRRRESSPSKRAQVLQNVASARGNGAAMGGLASLMKVAGSGSLIRLDPERSRTHKVSRRSTVGNVYASISVTKESREREERERKEEALRKEEERRRLEEEYGLLRQKERMERMRLSEKMKAERTVAAGMRDAYTMARVEKHLYGSAEDKEKVDTLMFVGLQLVPFELDDASRRLMTVEVIQI